MRQLRPANGTVWRTGTAGKQAQLGPARELRGSIEHCGTSSASSAFCTNSRPLCAPAPPAKNIACAERRFHHTCRPRSGRKFSTDGQKIHSKLKKDAVKGSGKRAKWPIPAMPRATGLACGNARIGHGTRRVAAVSQQLALCGRIPAHGWICRLRAGRCCCHRRCGHQRREREPIRGYQIRPAFGLAGLALQAELRGSPNRAFPKCTIHGTCINPIGAAPECILSKFGACTPREVWFLNRW